MALVKLARGRVEAVLLLVICLGAVCALHDGELRQQTFRSLAHVFCLSCVVLVIDLAPVLELPLQQYAAVNSTIPPLPPPSLPHWREVGDPPQFISQPQDVVVFDQDIMLSCEVTGNPVPAIRWFRGSTELPGDDPYIVFENGSLLLAHLTEGVHASREGLPYYCLATNLIGPDNVLASIRSRTATVSLACEFNSAVYILTVYVFMCFSPLSRF